MSIYQKKYRYGKAESEPSEIEITSLLDILVILLFFLIKNYNASNLTIDLPERIDVPFSTSVELGSHATIVFVDRDKNFYINDKPIGKVNLNQQGNQLGVQLAELRKENRGRFLASQEKGKKSTEDYSSILNIVMDEEVEYYIMDQVMKLANSQGYEHFKFIVQGED